MEISVNGLLRHSPPLPSATGVLRYDDIGRLAPMSYLHILAIALLVSFGCGSSQSDPQRRLTELSLQAPLHVEDERQP